MVMIYSHWTDFKGVWRWKNFPIHTLACPCCGEYYHDPESLDLIQKARNITGKPYYLNSAHRCELHNAYVGGVSNSEHLRIAFDISLRNHNRFDLIKDLKAAGFTTFGRYISFIHTDKRSNRHWFGRGAKKLWIS
jgi:hypothetical protein